MKTFVLGIMAAGAVLAATSASASADQMADQLRHVHDMVDPSIVVVKFYVEREDGQRADGGALGTVVGDNNLVMFSSIPIPSQVPIEQFHDFQIVVRHGKDLQKYEADYLGKDDQAQVAFVRPKADAKAPKLPVLKFDASAKAELGDPVISFVSLGEDDYYTIAMQSGRVAGSIERPYTLPMVAGEFTSLGTLGTPVFSQDGKAIGLVGVSRVNRGTAAKPAWQALEVIWPVERFAERLKNPPQGGKAVKQPWLGVQTLTPVTKDMAEYLKLGDKRGISVGQVIPQSPADKAGIKPEDIILALDGKPITGQEGQLVESFTNDLKNMQVGQEVTLEVWRGGKPVTVKVKLGDQPKGAGEAQRYLVRKFGLSVREMVLEDRIARDLPQDATGVVVAFVEPAGWASDGGLKPNDVIEKVQDQDVKTLADFKKIFDAEVAKKPKEVVMFVLRGKNETQLIRIEPRWDAEKAKGDDAK